MAAILKTRHRIFAEKGILKIAGGYPHLLVNAGTGIKNQRKHRSYGPGTKVILLL